MFVNLLIHNLQFKKKLVGKLHAKTCFAVFLVPMHKTLKQKCFKLISYRLWMIKAWTPSIFTVRKRSCGKAMFLHLSVILFTGGSAFPQCHGAGRPPPPPSAQKADLPLPRQDADTTKRYGQQADGKHPIGMHTCLLNVLCDSCGNLSNIGILKLTFQDLWKEAT